MTNPASAGPATIPVVLGSGGYRGDEGLELSIEQPNLAVELLPSPGKAAENRLRARDEVGGIYLTKLAGPQNEVGLIRFRRRQMKGGYDGPDGRRLEEAKAAS